MHKVLLVLLFCSPAVAQEAPATHPGDAAAVAEPPAKTDAPVLSELAAKMEAAYAKLDSLYIESQVYESMRKAESSAPQLTFDDKAPLIVDFKVWMRPEHELRAEAYVNDKQVWGMVSQRMKDGKSMVVQWNETQITKPHPAGRWDEGRNSDLDGNVPGHCTAGLYIFSLVGEKKADHDTLPSWLWNDRIAGGKYEGRVKDALGNECYCVSCPVGTEVFFKHYVDTRTFLVTQIDKAQQIMTPDLKVIGVGSQRWTLKNVPQQIEADKFSFPDPGEREVVEVKVRCPVP
jgi:hypothetical protein